MRRVALLAALILCLSFGLFPSPAPARARPRGAAPAATPRMFPNFVDETVFSGLTAPTAVAFSPDGRVFVAEQAGVIKVFDNLGDSTPDTFADLRPEVQNYSERGLLGLTLDPGFPEKPFVYVTYSLDAPLGSTPPVWSDNCPADVDAHGCPIGGRVSRLTAGGNQMVPGSEEVLIEGWCQQFPYHAIDDIHFGPDGYLYVSAGEGADSGTPPDYGQLGDTPNACGDPPGSPGTALAPPDSQGGALRSQSVRRPPGQPRTLSGTVLRIDPATGEGAPGNPLASDPDQNARRIIAYGLRNPFRFVFRPGTSEIWIADVDWFAHDEIDVIPSIPPQLTLNFGWPCYQGPEPQPTFFSLGLSVCANLHVQDFTLPYFSYPDNTKPLTPNDDCSPFASSISGIAFYTGASYPNSFQSALFFADFTRSCIWVMFPGPDGHPDAATLKVFERTSDTPASGPVQLMAGPDGDLFWVDLMGGALHRIRHIPGDEPPLVAIQASTNTGPVPLPVAFTSNGTVDPEDGGALQYAWDLNGDGQFDDGNQPTASRSYDATGVIDVRLKVTDGSGQSSVSEPVRIAPGDAPPVVSMGVERAVGAGGVPTITFRARGQDPEDGELPPISISWRLTQEDCPGAQGCVGTDVFSGYHGQQGSFVEPSLASHSYLALTATGTDSAGVSAVTSIRLYPENFSFSTAVGHGGLGVRIAGHYFPPAAVAIAVAAVLVLAVAFVAGDPRREPRI